MLAHHGQAVCDLVLRGWPEVAGRYGLPGLIEERGEISAEHHQRARDTVARIAESVHDAARDVEVIAWAGRNPLRTVLAQPSELHTSFQDLECFRRGMIVQRHGCTRWHQILNGRVASSGLLRTHFPFAVDAENVHRRQVAGPDYAGCVFCYELLCHRVSSLDFGTEMASLRAAFSSACMAQTAASCASPGERPPGRAGPARNFRCTAIGTIRRVGSVYER